MESPFRDTAGVSLIETLLWDGASFPRMPGHIARLEAGAAALGRPCGGAQAALQAAVAPGVPARVRLTLDHAGTVAVTVAPLPPSPAVWRLGLAKVRLASGDPWLRIKSTRRAAYDQARATLPPGLDEAVFVNERDEVCDGTITTLFFDAGRGLATPPLGSGLLPGVLRAEMLMTGQCHEAVLPVASLPRVRLWVGNALRGLMPATWMG